MISMVIDMPHTPSELAESFARRDVEIDIREMSDDDAEVLASFLVGNGFKAVYHPEPVLDLILDWRTDYGILVSDGVRDIGANDPYRHFGTVRLTIEEVMEILPKTESNISPEDFESVF